MRTDDWREILFRVPPHLKRLREPARPPALRRAEALLGMDLPEPYRSFLACADGGWIGDYRIYGTPELRRLAAGRPSGARTPRAAAYVPFHPVDRLGVECLDASRPGGPVVWCRDPAGRVPEAPGPGEPHPIAARAFLEPADRLWTADTYVDFLDWTLDTILGLRCRVPGPVLAGQG